MTEERLKRLEAKISRTYNRSVREMKKKIRDELERYSRQINKWKKDLDEGRVTQAEFDEWLSKNAYQSPSNREMVKVLVEDTYNSNAIAAQMIKDHTYDVYALNANRTAYEIDSEVGYYTNYTLYSKDTVERLVSENPELLPNVGVDKAKDIAWNSKKLRNEMIQGILQGESVQKIAKRYERVLGMNRNSAIRNARTATTSAQNGGRLRSFERAKDLGIGVEKVWIATVDGKTRHSHRLLDGQTQQTNKPFISGAGYKLMYPGDPSAHPSEIYQCRCRIIGRTKYSEVNPRDLENRFSRLPDGVTYDEWRKACMSKEKKPWD